MVASELLSTTFYALPWLYQVKEAGMHLIETIWNGLGGVGSTAMLLKMGYMLFLAVLFWIICEFAKHIITVGFKLMTDALRYLAVIVRGWPEGSEEDRSKGKEIRK
jgi:hypothetical protein